MWPPGNMVEELEMARLWAEIDEGSWTVGQDTMKRRDKSWRRFSQPDASTNNADGHPRRVATRLGYGSKINWGRPSTRQ